MAEKTRISVSDVVQVVVKVKHRTTCHQQREGGERGRVTGTRTKGTFGDVGTQNKLEQTLLLCIRKKK